MGDTGANVVTMVGLGLLVSVVAPVVVAQTRAAPVWRRLQWPPAVAAAVFVALHLTVVLLGVPPALEAVVLLVGAYVFWQPVFGDRRLDDLGAGIYLFLSTPALDLAGVIMVARGDSGGGLAMIVGMLPMGLLAVVLTWRHITAEDTAARALDELDGVGGGPLGARS